MANFKSEITKVFHELMEFQDSYDIDFVEHCEEAMIATKNNLTKISEKYHMELLIELSSDLPRYFL